MSVPGDAIKPSTKLEESEHNRIFKDVILKESGFHEVTSSETPKAIILAGQPGAGKGGLTREALKELERSGGAISVDPDELRKHHPDAGKFQAEKPYTWADDTHADASQWAKELRTAAIDSKKNLILDTTLGDPGKAVELVETLQKAGYTVEIRAMAAHQLESELGVDKRFTDGLEREGFGRYVPQRLRDQVYADLPATLDTVHGMEKPVPISVYSRESVTEPVYSSQRDSGKPGAALNEAREARVNNPVVVDGLSKGWHTQANWHAQFDETMHRNGAALGAELRDKEVAKGVSQNVEKIDALSKKFAPLTEDSTKTVPVSSSPSLQASHSSSSEQVAQLLSALKRDDPSVSASIRSMGQSESSHQMQEQAKGAVTGHEHQTPSQTPSSTGVQQGTTPSPSQTKPGNGGQHM